MHIPEVRCSAAAHGDDDFDGVTILQQVSGELAARDDLAVAFQCDTLADQSHRGDEFGYCLWLGKLLLLTIDTEFDHFIAWGVRIRAAFYTKRV